MCVQEQGGAESKIDFICTVILRGIKGNNVEGKRRARAVVCVGPAQGLPRV